MTVRIEAFERHHVRLVVVPGDLDSARAHPGERGADVIAGGEPKPEVQERLRDAGVLRRVQCEVEAVGVA